MTSETDEMYLFFDGDGKGVLSHASAASGDSSPTHSSPADSGDEDGEEKTSCSSFVSESIKDRLRHRFAS